MPALTIEALRENPWIVLSDPLPVNPEPLLLRVAYLAADYCCRSEHLIMTAIREGDHEPAAWTSDELCPDAHEESEAWWQAALERLEAIGALYERNYGVKLEI